MSAPLPVFVLGTPRSGTTWLGNLLASHPKVAAVTAPEHGGIHESHLMSHTRYCFPDPIDLEPFLERYQQEDYFKLTGLRVEALLEQHGGKAGDVVDHFGRIMGAYAGDLGAQAWVEKTPNHAIYHRELCSRFPAARFVVIERKFRATLRSQLERYARPGAPRWLQVLEKVLRFVCDQRALAQLEAEQPDRTLRISYETLLADPQGTMEQVQTFLGLDVTTLDSAFTPSSSFTPGQDPSFQFSPLAWACIEATRSLCYRMPLGILSALRRKRDREAAASFPRYSKIALSRTPVASGSASS